VTRHKQRSEIPFLASAWFKLLFRSLSMGRYDLTEKEWPAIRPHLPNKPRGIPRVDDRRVLNGIFWCLRPIRCHSCQSALNIAP
jgi:hypothetical protein